MISIDTINLHKLSMTLNHPFTTSFGTLHHKDLFIIEVIDKKDHRGYGETVAFLTPWYTEETVQTNEHIITDFLIDLLRDNPLNHPDDVHDIFSPIKGNRMAKASLEGAIWDLYAKQLGIPLAKALGGVAPKIDVGISIGIQTTTTQLIETIHRQLEQGYKRVKLKIKPGLDVELLREVRQAFPDTPIMADANSAYTLHDMDLLKQLVDFNLMMIEQPLAHDDIIDHAKLQTELNTPICLDESIHSYEDARKAIELGSCKVINIKIGRVGGLTEAKKIHDLCLRHDIAVWCGGMLEAGIGRAHNIALTTLPQFILPGDTAGSSHYWQQDIITPEVIVDDGVIHVPEKPGIGYDINWDVMKQYTVDVKKFKF